MTRAAAVYDRLRFEIVTLERLPGSRIDKWQLCEQLNLSRYPVSEALNRLSDERLVDVLPQSGSYVSRIRQRDVEEASFVRRALEATALRDLTGPVDPSFLERLDRILQHQQAASELKDAAEFYRLDVRFHTMLMQKFANPRAIEILESVGAPLERARRILVPNTARTSQTIEEHRSVVRELALGDGDGAARCMDRHLSNGSIALRELAAERADLFES